MKHRVPCKFQQEEDEANAFAIELLMPEQFVRDEVKKLGGIDLADDRKIKELARRFQVPVALMAMRLGQISQNLTRTPAAAR